MKLYAGFLDIAKAYPSVWWDGMWKKLLGLGVKGRMWRVLRTLYSKYEVGVRVQGEVSEWYEEFVGLREGCVLSPLLFALYINGVVEELNKNGGGGVKVGAKEILCLLFADDIVIVDETPEGLQKSLDVMWKYSRKWRFEYNTGADKSEVMIFGDKAPIKKVGATVARARSGAENAVAAKTTKTKKTTKEKAKKAKKKAKKVATKRTRSSNRAAATAAPAMAAGATTATTPTATAMTNATTTTPTTTTTTPTLTNATTTTTTTTATATKTATPTTTGTGTASVAKTAIATTSTTNIAMDNTTTSNVTNNTTTTAATNTTTTATTTTATTNTNTTTTTNTYDNY